jgi:hypothetical protein
LKTAIKDFRRHADGSWECVAASTLNGPMGRIQVNQGLRVWPGMRFMGVDLAKWLDAEVDTDGLLDLAE